MAKKLSQYRGEDALILMADILEPALIIMQDPDFVKEARERHEATAIKVAIKNHVSEVMEILAVYNEMTVEEFKKKCNIASLPVMVMEIMEDKELMSFFTSQDPKVGETAFGDASESTTEAEPPETS